MWILASEARRQRRAGADRDENYVSTVLGRGISADQ
jgi:hypothetical protein